MNEEQEKASRGMPAGEAVNGLDFMQYQDDSVVSRQYRCSVTSGVLDESWAPRKLLDLKATMRGKLVYAV
jgi:hypothetical protein